MPDTAALLAKAKAKANPTVQKRISGGTSTGGRARKATKPAGKTAKRPPAPKTKKTARKPAKKAAKKATAKPVKRTRKSTRTSPVTPASTRRSAVAGTGTHKTAAQLAAQLKGTEASIEAQELQAASFRTLVRQANGDAGKIEDIKALIREDYAKLVPIMPDLFGDEAKTNGTKPAEDKKSDADGLEVVDEGTDFRVVKAKGSKHLTIQEKDDDGNWVNTRKAIKFTDMDQWELYLSLNGDDVDKACERKLAGLPADPSPLPLRVIKGFGRSKRAR